MIRVIAALLVAVVLGCQSAEDQVAEFQKKAEAYIESEQWAEAKIELLNVIQKQPENAAARFSLGETLAKLEEYGDALWQYREAVRLEPTNLGWRYTLGALEILARQIDQAEVQINYILEHDADNVNGLMLRARLHGLRSEFEETRADLERVLALSPNHTGGLTMMARVLSTLKRDAESEVVLDRLIEVEPNTVNYVLKGAFLVAMDRHDEAIAAFEKAIEVATDQKERRAAHLSLVNLYMSRNEIDRAEAQLLAAREGSERDEEFQYSLTRFYMMTKQPEKAEEVLRERVSNFPDQAGPMIGLARFQYMLGRPDDALATLDEAMKIDPKNEDGRILRSEFLLEQRLGDEEALAEVRKLIEDVLEDNPASVRGQFAQARVLLLDKKYEESSILLRRVIEEQPDELSYYLLGTAYLGMGQNDLARAEFLSALRQNPQYVAARRQLAALYLGSGNAAAAAAEARKGLESEPDEYRMKLLLAESLVSLRDAEEAGQTLDSLDLASEEIPLQMRLRAAAIYLDLARFDAARKVVESALEKDPTNAAALQSLIEVEARAGQPTAALEAINTAIETDPKNAELYRLRGSYYMGFGRPGDGKPRFPNEAQADLLQAEALEPESSRTQVMIGRLRNRMGSDRQALEAFDKAIALDPSNGEAYMLKGAVLESQERLDPAAETYRVLLERPDRGGVGSRALAIAMNNLAWLLANSEKPAPDDLDRALELAQDAKELLPDDPSVADTLGWVMYKRAIPSAAISLFREAIDGYEPGSPTRALSRYHLALSYEATGDSLRAIEEIRLCLSEAESFPGREDAEAALARLEAS